MNLSTHQYKHEDKMKLNTIFPYNNCLYFQRTPSLLTQNTK